MLLRASVACATWEMSRLAVWVALVIAAVVSCSRVLRTCDWLRPGWARMDLVVVLASRLFSREPGMLLYTCCSCWDMARVWASKPLEACSTVAGMVEKGNEPEVRRVVASVREESVMVPALMLERVVWRVASCLVMAVAVTRMSSGVGMPWVGAMVLSWPTAPLTVVVRVVVRVLRPRVPVRLLTTVSSTGRPLVVEVVVETRVVGAVTTVLTVLVTRLVVVLMMLLTAGGRGMGRGEYVARTQAGDSLA